MRAADGAGAAWAWGADGGGAAWTGGAGGGSTAGTRATISSTMSSMECPVVSRTQAPSATVSGDAVRVESSRSRRARAAGSSSDDRRRARSSSLAVRNTLRVASGNTTLAMSRPSTTPPPFSATHCRWRATNSVRTSGQAATALTALPTSGMRSRSVMSSPSRSTRSPTSIVTPRTTSDMSSADAEAGSSLWRITATAAERYMAPVSRWARPRRAATALATVDLPDPTGPSMAITVTSGVVTPAIGTSGAVMVVPDRRGRPDGPRTSDSW